MKFTVYQINLSENDYSNPDLRELYLDTTFRPTDRAIAKARSMYKAVAEIETTSFDDVFTIGNIGPEKAIKRLGRMHSVSVGDVIVREDGVSKFVDSFGFGNVKF